jgi:hypothetical protein
LLLLAAAVLLGCPKKDDVIIETAEGKELTSEDIDRDPIALLPGGFVGLAYLDAPQLYGSQFGPKVISLAERVVPVPASAGFDPRRDVQRVYVGLYSMQGADVAGVITGSFDREKIEQAARSAEKTPLGQPIVYSQYAGRNLYTAQNVGFVVLTRRTVLFGNETGMRRALDRIKEGRVKRELPEWLDEMMQTPNAPMAIGIDLRAQPVTDAIRANLPFLEGLETARMLGNFQSPGINFAGTLSYGNEEQARQGATKLEQFRQTLEGWGPLMAIFGIAQPIRKLEAQAKGSEAQFVMALDGQDVDKLLDQAGTFLGTPAGGEPVPATLSPGVGQGP